jgi:phage terminase Nu1 subunit (DNA packaging protein)
MRKTPNFAGFRMPVTTPHSGASLADLAQTLGVSDAAIRKAVRTGRLVQSIRTGAMGRITVTDVSLARREWHENSNSSQSASHPYLTTAEERRRLLRVQRHKVQIQNARLLGRLIPAAEAETMYAQRVVEARTKLLGLPSRAKQRLPHLTDHDMAVLDALIRESLEELANSVESTNGGPTS